MEQIEWVIILSVILATIARFIQFSKTPTDTWTHLYFIKSLASGNSSLSKGIDLSPYCGHGRSKYPILFHKILSFFDFDVVFGNRLKINRILEIVFICVWVSILSITFSVEESFLIVSFFIISPHTYTIFSRGPVNKGISPRGISEFLLNSVVVFLLCALAESSTQSATTQVGYIYFPIIVIILASAMLSSKFAVQVVVLVFFPFSLFIFPQFQLFLSILSAVVLSYVLTQGGFLKSVVEQVEHITTLYEKIKEGKVGFDKRLQLLPIGTPFVNQLKHYLIDFLPTAAVIKFPLVLVVAWDMCNSSGFPEGFQLILIAGFVFILTSLPLFLVLGEAERYINSVYVCFCIYLVVSDSIPGWLLYALVWYCFFYALCELLIKLTFTEQHKSKDCTDEDIDKIFRLIPSGSTVLCNPLTLLGGSRIFFEVGHVKWVYPGFWERSAQDAFTRFELKYPVLKNLGVADVITIYGADVYVADASNGHDMQLVNWLKDSGFVNITDYAGSGSKIVVWVKSR